MASGDSKMADKDKALHAPMEWAQRKDKLYLTIDVDDVVEPQIELTETTLTFRARGGAEKKWYEAKVEFFKEVDPKVHWIKTDFNKWKDEDDSDYEDDTGDMDLEAMMSKMGGLGGMDNPMGMMNNMGGMGMDGPDVGGRDSEDSDDEDLPDLE
uniref:CS domain-containing protein n=1 Tax=Magallana gigas TaxID=29159 RepID=A0A8W8MAD6_MAGGI|nr:co-chaperone protein daf-41 isoform X3 [Crassostrea gigas]